MNFDTLNNTWSAFSSIFSGHDGRTTSCTFNSNICSLFFKGFPSISCVYPNSFNFSIDVLISLGLNAVNGDSVISYLIVPSLFTYSLCIARRIPLRRFSGVWSLLDVPFTPFIKSG